MRFDPIITDFANTDLYKISMGQAVMFGRIQGVSLDNIDVEYRFTDRNDSVWPDGFVEELREQIYAMRLLGLDKKTRLYLQGNCPYLRDSFLDFLEGYQFNPNEVTITDIGHKKFALKVRGPWYRTIYWEVPLLKLISTLYFKMMGIEPSEDYQERAKEKGIRLNKAGVKFADFGTRRAFSDFVHTKVVDALSAGGCNNLVGTSNVAIARDLGLRPIGTHAHEWFMVIAALFGYKQATHLALKSWADEYDGALGIALTDTFTTEVFFRDFGSYSGKLFDGLRQDSGDPIRFAEQAIAAYTKMGIDPLTKTIIFSDGLTTSKAIEIHEWCKGKIGCSFGIGTHFSNDVGVKPRNIVIKATAANGVPTVKLSDVPGKRTGSKEAIEHCLYSLGIS